MVDPSLGSPSASIRTFAAPIPGCRSSAPDPVVLASLHSLYFYVYQIGVVIFCPSDNFAHCLALPMPWCASVHALFFWYLLCDPRRCENSRKVHTLWRVSASGAQHVVTWTKQTWIKHHNTTLFRLQIFIFELTRKAFDVQVSTSKIFLSSSNISSWLHYRYPRTI